MKEIKARPLTCVKVGLIYPEHGTLWRVVNFSTGDGLWIVECCFDSSFTAYKTEEHIRKILEIPLDK